MARLLTNGSPPAEDEPPVNHRNNCNFEILQQQRLISPTPLARAWRPKSLKQLQNFDFDVLMSRLKKGAVGAKKVFGWNSN